MEKAKYKQFIKFMRRATPLEPSPELNLIIALLGQAWIDADNITDSESVSFFVDGRAAHFAELIGIDSDFLQEVFMKHHPKSYEAVNYVR